MVWECDQDQGLQEKWPQWSLYWTWEALPPRVPGTGVSWTTLDQTLRSTTYTWMIKFEIAGWRVGDSRLSTERRSNEGVCGPL